MCVALLLLEDPDERLDKVWFLEEVAPSLAFVSEGVDECHSVFEHSSVPLQQQFVDNLPFLLLGPLTAVEQVKVHVGVDYLLLGPLSP